MKTNEKQWTYYVTGHDTANIYLKAASTFGLGRTRVPREAVSSVDVNAVTRIATVHTVSGKSYPIVIGPSKLLRQKTRNLARSALAPYGVEVP